MFLSVALVLFYFALEAENPRRKALFLALFGVAAGCAFLTKGFLAFAVLCAAVVPFMLWERRTGKLLRLAWLPLLTVALVALPWCVMIALREPDFWPQFFWEEHVRRFFGGHAQHARAVLVLLPWILGGVLPWTVFAPAAVIGLGKEKLKDPLIRFAICWLVFPFLFFSISSGKLGTYILPCFPPLALLIGVGLHRYFDQGGSKAFVAGAWAIILLLDVAIVAIIAVSVTGGALLAGRLAEARQFLYGRTNNGNGCSLFRRWSSGPRYGSGRSSRALRCTGWPAVRGAVPVHGGGELRMPQAVEDFCAPEAFLARDSARVAPGAPLFARAACSTRSPGISSAPTSSCWPPTGEFEYGLIHPNDKDRELELDDFASFVAQYPPTELVTAIMDRQFYGPEGAICRRRSTRT